jgi:outer membrane protein OmpA-like peptidoglycan-associated protein
VRFTLFVAVAAVASVALAQQRSFVACPIVRDTKTSPCYLAESGGETYYLGTQQETGEAPLPQLKHEVLVEGRVAEGPKVCGGIPLQPVSVSVLKEVNLSCNTLLPAEPGIDAPPVSRAQAAPREPLSVRHEFTILYPFNDTDLENAAIGIVTEAADYAKRIGASSVKVNGFRATSVLSNGERLIEQAGIAEKRAQIVATLLRGLGVSGVTVEWKADAEPGDGANDPSRRRVTISVSPAVTP